MDKKQIIGTVKQELVDMLGLKESDIDTTKSFDKYGIDSAVGIGIISNLSDTFDLDLDPAELYDNPTVEALANHIHAMQQEAGA
ncbi:MAG: acyl carrier protein [Alcanivoracaceae bacterium]|nr:acyl carrier protein [Alcanivoracaceae bacterium]